MSHHKKLSVLDHWNYKKMLPILIQKGFCSKVIVYIRITLHLAIPGTAMLVSEWNTSNLLPSMMYTSSQLNIFFCEFGSSHSFADLLRAKKSARLKFIPANVFSMKKQPIPMHCQLKCKILCLGCRECYSPSSTILCFPQEYFRKLGTFFYF